MCECIVYNSRVYWKSAISLYSVNYALNQPEVVVGTAGAVDAADAARLVISRVFFRVKAVNAA